ncbi:MAG: phage baseplate protein, partial [Methylomonas sp.]
LRERLFGAKLVNNAVCPQCEERIEWEQNIADLVVGSADVSATDRFSLQQDGYRLCFRLPNSKDMAGLEGLSEIERAQKQLLKRLIVSAEYAGRACEPEQIPESVVRALNERIEALDPQAEIRIQLTCPECSNRWDVFFDIAGFLWAEVNEWAERMLQSIHKLAWAYGWSERDILNLSPVRRQLYLGMIGP